VILSDRESQAALQSNTIVIIPTPSQEQFTSTAIDLRLDRGLLIWEPRKSPSGSAPAIRPFGEDFDVKRLMDDPMWARKEQIDLNHGYRFDEKGQFLLAYTIERISLPHRSRIAARVEGKSSLARLGLGVHVTAPTIHAGFGFKAGVAPEETAQPIQLEMFNISGLPIILDYKMPICQLILEEIREVPQKGYQGQFNDQPLFPSS
jgi:dCTP deaminase